MIQNAYIPLVLGLECYRWTTADYEIINNGGWKKENERRMCVDVYNYVFAPDESSYDRKCGSCWCCKPETLPGLLICTKNLFVNENGY